jgi:hypothetical protein
MAAAKSLPSRPSLESLRKQAKKLARDRSLSLRDAQLVLAREYGFAGWQDLTAEVSQRLGTGLERAAAQARRLIQDSDVERLKQLLAAYPAILAWRGDDWDSKGGLLGIAAGAYADSFDPDRERTFTRAACAELLIDAGSAATPSVCDGLLESRARGLLQLFHRKGLLPRTLKFLAALGDLDAIRTALDEDGNDLVTVNEAFVTACRFQHDAVASLLLERSIALDPELGKRIDGSVGRLPFIRFFIEKGAPDPAQAAALGLWKAFVMGQVQRAHHERDLTTFITGLQREPWLLGEAFVWFQKELIEGATLNGRRELIAALLDLDPAILRRQPPPPSQAIEFAFTYANTDLIPLLTRIWPLPDDLPYAAGTGNLSRVKQWFDASGAPALGDLNDHYPYNDARARAHLRWAPPTAQQVLDVALAFSVINRHFDVADFLLARGADINTNWNSHEPASILHHLVSLQRDYEPMRFLIDRGIDMTIKDYRWNSNAAGWARYGYSDEKMAGWLEEAERQRELKR